MENTNERIIDTTRWEKMDKEELIQELKHQKVVLDNAVELCGKYADMLIERNKKIGTLEYENINVRMELNDVLSRSWWQRLFNIQ